MVALQPKIISFDIVDTHTGANEGQYGRELDKLLNMDAPEGQLGLPITFDNSDEPPIVIIEGTAGAGKTTLALQSAVASAKNKDYRTIFLSLEQSAAALTNTATAFGMLGGGNVRLVDRNTPAGDEGGNGAIELVHLSPLPLSKPDREYVFDDRFAELQQILHTLRGSGTELQTIFYLDSLNGLTTRQLERDEIHRLFGLFRANRIPAVITLEAQEMAAYQSEEASAQCVFFLADVVIRLTRDSSRSYLLHFLEIIKSRISRQGMGRHHYKIRTKVNAQEIEHDPRRGIVVYPSVHSVLSRSRKEGEHDRRGDQENKYVICKQSDGLHNIIQSESIRAGECIAVVGPHGTHKLALAMNLAAGSITESGADRSHMLIISFGGTGEIDFGGIAWTQTREKWRQLKATREPVTSQMKFWSIPYKTDDGGLQATSLTFRIGELTPEECFYVIDGIVRRELPTSVLLCDTAELWSGFPLLRADPMFFPALIDLLENRQVLTVAIGVQEPSAGMNRDLNFALLARANYRVVLSHNPDTVSLAENIIKEKLEEKSVDRKESNAPSEQFVSLVIDNVTGRHYSRQPIWIHVVQDIEAHKKTLNCYARSELKHMLEAMELPHEAK